MNRLKKYIREKGIKLECDYPWLPYEVSYNIFIEGIYINSEKATIITYYNVIMNQQQLNRDGSITFIPDETDEPFERS